MISATALRVAAWVAGIAATAVVLPLLAGDWAYAQYMIEIIMVFILATTGLNIAIGFAGQFQMAQGAIMGFAAYTLSILLLDYGWSLGLAALASVLLALLVACVVAALSARLTSHYLLLATFSIQVIAVGLLREFSTFTGGANGRPAVIGFDLFGVELYGSTTAYSIFLMVVAGLGLLICDWLKRSYFGLGIQAVRQNERMTRASGVQAGRLKFVAVFLSGIYAAVAGVLVGPVHTYLVPDSFGIEITLLFLIIVILGGAGSVLGVALATVVLAVASQVAQSATTAWPLIYGLFVMTVLAISNRGLAGLADRFRPLLALFPMGSQPAEDAPVRPSAAGLPAAAAGLAPHRQRKSSAQSAASPVDLEVATVSKSFGGVSALDNVSFAVTKGAVHGLVGPNGSGKTTLFEVISGFVRHDSGTVRALGRDIGRLGAVERSRLGIGRSFQHPTILGESTLLENVLMGVLRELPASHRLATVAADANPVWKRRAMEALALVGLAEQANEPASQLPYGQRKLLDIARVVAAKPSLVLLDEPVAGVDATSANYVRDVVEMLRARGSTVVLVEHNMRFVMGLSDVVTVLNTGQVIASGPPEEIASNEAVIRAYLGSPGAGAGPARQSSAAGDSCGAARQSMTGLGA